MVWLKIVRIFHYDFAQVRVILEKIEAKLAKYHQVQNHLGKLRPF